MGNGERTPWAARRVSAVAPALELGIALQRDALFGRHVIDARGLCVDHLARIRRLAQRGRRAGQGGGEIAGAGVAPDFQALTLHDEVALRDVQLEVQLLFAPDDAFLDFNDRCGSVVRINDGLANLKKHESVSFRQLSGYHTPLVLQFAAPPPTGP